MLYGSVRTFDKERLPLIANHGILLCLPNARSVMGQAAKMP